VFLGAEPGRRTADDCAALSNKVQRAINALSSASATLRDVRQSPLDSSCNKAQRGQRRYFLQRQHCAIFRDTWQCTLATKCNQKQSAKGGTRQRNAGVEHKGVGFTGLSFPVQVPLHQTLGSGCILEHANPVWDARIFFILDVRKHPLPGL